MCCMIWLQLVADRAGEEYVAEQEETRLSTEEMLSDMLGPDDDESDDDSAASISG